ncbi:MULTISPECIES: hypothetical protein [unclassified Fusibacter]|uniref:hypothetical protein n=1 Tax=unclassified Fusibacter TaxID=2624464 RepID=UPI001011B9B6|nr:MULTISPECIES: hypothetical protein [unclassified Fusibacter]MCK8061498.1 hypothetical protein [Fusibacter sp. A2]NPE23683.1 hypothetical protein [Fusibacter sp. A1]RXV58861.1 hypothetical protein DWB64_18015 [Fusibacter sp. A1]
MKVGEKMNRFTRQIVRNDETSVILDHGYHLVESGIISGKAVERLAEFETFLEQMVEEYEQCAQQLETMRENKKEKTLHFKEVLGKKMMIQQVLIKLKWVGIDVEIDFK